MKPDKSWSPVLEGAQAEEALEVAIAIANDISFPWESAWKWGWERECPQSLGFGNAGIALFFCYMAKTFRSRQYLETALDFLREALLNTRWGVESPGLLNGDSGILWTLAHVNGCFPGEVVATAVPSLCEDLLRQWCRDAQNVPAVVMDGLAGLCIYAAELPCGTWPLEISLEVLRSLSPGVQTGKYEVNFPVSRRTEFEIRSLIGGHQLQGQVRATGVGYGVAGVVGGLMAAHAIGAAEANTSEMIETAIEWIMRHKRTGVGRQAFPAAIGVDTSLLPNGWMTGDPGVVTVLYNAGLMLGRDDWCRVALEIARADAQLSLLARKPGEVNHYNLSDGLSGRGHLYNRLFQATGDELFADAARHCYTMLFKGRCPGEGTGGFHYKGIDFKGFLTGAAGLGLALMAAASTANPEWDRALLASFGFPGSLRPGVPGARGIGSSS